MYQSAYITLPLVGWLRSTGCHGGRVLRGERELLLSMLEHLPVEDPISEAIDFVFLLVAETARGLHKNGERSLFSSIPYTERRVLLAKQPRLPLMPRRVGGCLEDRIKNSLHGEAVLLRRGIL